MFIVIRKQANLGHEFDADNYFDSSCIVCPTLEQAVMEYFQWVNSPGNTHGKNHAVIYRNDLPNNISFIREVEKEKKRQLAEMAETDAYLTAHGM